MSLFLHTTDVALVMLCVVELLGSIGLGIRKARLHGLRELSDPDGPRLGLIAQWMLDAWLPLTAAVYAILEFMELAWLDTDATRSEVVWLILVACWCLANLLIAFTFLLAEWQRRMNVEVVAMLRGLHERQRYTTKLQADTLSTLKQRQRRSAEQAPPG